MPGTYHSTMHTHAHGTHDGIYRIERSRCARAQGVLGACGSYNIAQTIIYSLSLLLLVTGCQAAQRLLSRNILGAALWPAQRRQERERAVTKCGGCERACGGDASRILFFRRTNAPVREGDAINDKGGGHEGDVGVLPILPLALLAGLPR